MHDKTMTFSLGTDREGDIKRVLTIVYDALREKGYNPINQMVGYILSEDPTYITTHNNARSLIRRIDRDELLQVLLKSYLDGWENQNILAIKGSPWSAAEKPFITGAWRTNT